MTYALTTNKEICNLTGMAPRSSGPQLRSRRPLPQRVASNHSILRSIESGQLKLSQPGDQHERAVDQIANRIMRISDTQAANVDQVQENQIGHENTRASPSIFRSDGDPMPMATRRFFESCFGVALDHIQIHTDRRAASSAHAIGASAYTFRNHLVFAVGEFAPNTRRGLRLIAHELAHQIEQTPCSDRFVYRSINESVMENMIRVAGGIRSENLMILYIDSRRRDATMTQWYKPKMKVMEGERSSFTHQFLRKRRIRSLILQRFRDKVRWIIRNGIDVNEHTGFEERWLTLDWLYNRFPQAHIPPPRPGLDVLRDIIEHEATLIVPEGQFLETGFDIVQDVPMRRALSQFRTRQDVAMENEAINKIRDALRGASDRQAYRELFGGAFQQGIGGHLESMQARWAQGLVTFVETINELRKGQTPSTALPPRESAPETFDQRMARAAQEVWQNRLSSGQRNALGDDDVWKRSIAEIWTELKGRLTWALKESGSIHDADSFSNGTYSAPGQSAM